ncbi:hypothetical protein BKA65DRAFT_68720 [Rhexocercosporidium sp. MPI-PUGE-AT-0058]|nr:hypothetical protein BKA65DRAFT_68720 [Rhexocercosporidium sp. MPI-PUGE-AT-0058]
MSLSLPSYDQSFSSNWIVQEEDDVDTLNPPYETTPPCDVDIEDETTPRPLTPIPAPVESAPPSAYLTHLPSSWLLPTKPAKTRRDTNMGRGLTRGPDDWKYRLRQQQGRQMTADALTLRPAQWRIDQTPDRSTSFSRQRQLMDEDRLEALRKELSQRLAKVVSLEKLEETVTKAQVGKVVSAARVSGPVSREVEDGQSFVRQSPSIRNVVVDTEEEVWGGSVSLYSATWGDAPHLPPPTPAAYSSRASDSTFS